MIRLVYILYMVHNIFSGQLQCKTVLMQLTVQLATQLVRQLLFVTNFDDFIVCFVIMTTSIIIFYCTNIWCMHTAMYIYTWMYIHRRSYVSVYVQLAMQAFFIHMCIYLYTCGCCMHLCIGVCVCTGQVHHLVQQVGRSYS